MSHTPITDHREQAKDAILGLLVGDMVGEGAHRRVYALGDGSRVLKVERFQHEFANVAEWRTWDELQWDPRCRPWLAPCHSISGDGTALLMERCRDLTDAEWAALGPVPAWLGDTKRSNWGWLVEPGHLGRAVMRDYAITKLVHRGSRGAKLVPKTGDGA